MIEVISAWLSANWLAAYGALIGTLAFGLNFARYRNSLKNSNVSLQVTFEKRKDFDRNVQRLSEAPDGFGGGAPQIVEVFDVKVRNLGNIDAFIQSAGVICDDGTQRPALGHYPNSQHRMLHPIADLPEQAIKPKSSQVYTVWLKRDEPAFTPVRGYAEDKTGKLWHSKKKKL